MGRFASRSPAPARIREVRPMHRLAEDNGLAADLWALSERFTGA